MTEPDFDNVFADLMDGDEELQAFLQSVQEQLPRVVAQLRTDDGSVVPADAAWPWPADLCRRLCEEAGAANGLVAARTADGEWLYGIPITELEGVLLLVFPGRAGNIVDEPHDLDLLQGVIAFARLQQQHQLLLIENQQIFRQINVLNQQHSALVEDNFRQYRLIQEKEKDYARKLESEIARQTAELRKTNARLEEASRLQSEFLANMSHELRTPMNAIIGFTELLTETELKDDQAEYVNTIKQAGSNLLVLINDILDLAKIEAGKIDLEKEPFEVRQLVDSVAGLFRLPAMEKKVAFSVDMGAEVPLLVVGDANRLRQVLINLAGNAMKFTDHGEVAIVVRGGRQQGERLELHFAVRDSGIGIAP
ncbi:MAG: ATP-binding protein, partial [Desulfobulbaceae bacterium]|nr:ATP-binding protein [Desulfobulbaceae bacterium]